MADLVKVRSAQGRSHKQFLISRGLFEKYPDHYVAIESKKSPAKPAEAKTAD